MDKGGEGRGETDLWGRSSRREERRERGRGTDRQTDGDRMRRRAIIKNQN